MNDCRDITKVMALSDALGIGSRVRDGHARRTAAGSIFRGAYSGVNIHEAYDWVRIDYSDRMDVYRNST